MFSYKTSRFGSARSPALWLEVKEALGLEKFFSQFGQDKWILGRVYPDVASGFFVDIGSWDAEFHSNSKALEVAGWTGICIDPFPQEWRNRTCQLFEEVVYSRAGEVIQFRRAGAHGGVDKHIDSWGDEVANQPLVELTTTTIGEILERAAAPPFIHYMSIDTEGSEYEILKGMPFDRYTVGALTIEHNLEESKRQQIRDLLESKGYRLERVQIVDDWYVLDRPDLKRAISATTR
jgi:hypothetical protein